MGPLGRKNFFRWKFACWRIRKKYEFLIFSKIFFSQGSLLVFFSHQDNGATPRPKKIFSLKICLLSNWTKIRIFDFFEKKNFFFCPRKKKFFLKKFFWVDQGAQGGRPPEKNYFLSPIDLDPNTSFKKFFWKNIFLTGIPGNSQAQAHCEKCQLQPLSFDKFCRKMDQRIHFHLYFPLHQFYPFFCLVWLSREDPKLDFVPPTS